MASGVYEIVNLMNGKRYVGSSGELEKRRIAHFSMLRLDTHLNGPLQYDWNEYGETAFEFLIVGHCSPKGLVGKEQERMDMYDFDSLYNLSPTAGSNLGFKHSDEARANMSAGQLRREGNERRFGQVRSEETRARMSAAAKGKEKSDETRARMSIAQSNRSAETRAKISAAASNLSIETRAKRSASMKKMWERKRTEAALNQSIGNTQE